MRVFFIKAKTFISLLFACWFIFASGGSQTFAQQNLTPAQFATERHSFTLQLLNTAGSPYPDVTITLTNPVTGEQFLRTTSQTGEAVFTDLPDGNYRWKVETRLWVIFKCGLKHGLKIGGPEFREKRVIDLSTSGPHGMPAFGPTSKWLQFAERRDPEYFEFLERLNYGEDEPQPAADTASEHQTQKKEQETQQESGLAEGETDVPTAPASDSEPVGFPFESYNFLLEEESKLLEKLRVDLRKGVDPNQSDASGKTVLMLAANTFDGFPEFVKRLLYAGADPNAKDSFGDTALMFAARRGNEKVARLLLKAGADPKASNRFGVTPALYAADAFEGFRVMTELVRVQADINASDDNGRTPLMISAFSGDLETTLVLLEASADVNARDKQGNSVLTYATEGAAAGFGKKDSGRLIIERLKKAGAVE